VRRFLTIEAGAGNRRVPSRDADRAPIIGEVFFPSRRRVWRDTLHSIELNVKRAAPECGNQSVQFALEEDAALLESGWSWIAPRQTQFYLVR